MQLLDNLALRAHSTRDLLEQLTHYEIASPTKRPPRSLAALMHELEGRHIARRIAEATQICSFPPRL